MNDLDFFANLSAHPDKNKINKGGILAFTLLIGLTGVSFVLGFYGWAMNQNYYNNRRIAKIKAFYMRMKDDKKTVKAMDILFPGIGEIVGGSQREERIDVLKERIKSLNIDEKELWWYLDLRKFGTVKHSGFGLGLERLILFITGMGNIRDVIPFPRTPKNADF